MDCYQRKYGMQTHLFIATQKFRFFHQNLLFTHQINYPFLQIPTSSTHPSKPSKITIQITHVQRPPLQHLHQSSTNSTKNRQSNKLMQAQVPQISTAATQTNPVPAHFADAYRTGFFAHYEQPIDEASVQKTTPIGSCFSFLRLK